MQYRIKYEDSYHQIKTLVYDANYLSEVLTFAKKLGTVISIDALNKDGTYSATNLNQDDDSGDDYYQ